MTANIKRQVRVLGIDDGPHSREGKDVIVVGTCMRGALMIDGVMTTTIQRDGDDATEKIAEMVTDSHFHSMLKCIFIDGIAVGGFNVIDIRKLHGLCRIPIITVMRREPDLESIRRAMEKIGKDWRMIRDSPEIIPCNGIFIQLAGIDLERARKLLHNSTFESSIPEALRISHLIAAGIVLGHSRGEP